MEEIGSLFVITQSDSNATSQRLQGKVICLLRMESDLGKPGLLHDLCRVSKTTKVVVLLALDDRWLDIPLLNEEHTVDTCL